MDGTGLGNLIFLALLIGVFYVFLIRPQKRRVEEQRKLIGSIEPGDEIVTVGGLYGTVTSIGDEDMQIEIAPGTKVRYAKAAIARRVTESLGAARTQAFEPVKSASDDNGSDSTDTKTAAATTRSASTTRSTSSAKKTAARKTPAKKTTAKKTSAKTTSRKSSGSPSSRSNKRTR
ncbi:MAG TPA: preprotein translocase subunit YajC [Actinomycetota bacterium]|nr:preprotein translocase subunit YajC [Actinomycetota bacterium]